jgi:cell division transport system permease protein
MSKSVPYDLPFDTDSSARFIPWIIGLTTFIGCVFVLGTLAFSSLIGKWSMDLSGQATVQIPMEGNLTPQQIHTLKGEAVAFLKTQRGVDRAHALDTVSTYRLLEPWLGKSVEQLNLPIPLLIAITLDPKERFDALAASNELAKIAPGVRITQHEQVHQSILRAAEGFRLVGHFILMLITLACIGALIFSTYTGLIVHQDIIKILMLVGARPAYVAGQFQRHTLKLALKGTFYNYLLLGGVGALLLWFVGRLDFPLPVHGLSLPVVGSILFLVPLVMVLVMAMTARMTVNYVLARQP